MFKRNPIKRIFDLYTSDLEFSEIEKLIKLEASEVYEYFKSDIPKPDVNKSKFIRALIFLRSLINAFILKMNPARRAFYLISVFFLLVGLLQQLNLYIFFAFIILSILLAFELADKLTVKEELKLANRIQNNLLPREMYISDETEIAQFYEAAKEVGGDYFDLFNDINKNKHLVIGDISGKGFAAALYMVRVQAILSTLFETELTVKQILKKLNDHFLKKQSKGFFLTLSVLSATENGYNYFSAGHLPLLQYKNEDGKFVELNPKGIAIGISNSDNFFNSIKSESFKFNKGDVLLFYTDGLTEAMNTTRKQFGLDTVKRIIATNADRSAEEIKEEIAKALSKFKGDSNFHDDVTYIIIKYKNPNSDFSNC